MLIRIDGHSARVGEQLLQQCISHIAFRLDCETSALVNAWAPHSVPRVLAQLVLRLAEEFSSVKWNFVVFNAEDAFTLAVRCHDPFVGTECALTAVRWINDALSGQNAKALPSKTDFVSSRPQLCVGEETRLFIKEATRRDIPWTRLTLNVFRFGQGHLQRSIHSTAVISDRTSRLASGLATYKPGAALALREAGIPVAQSEIVTNVDQALKVVKKFGYPLVIKPVAMDKGVGVYLNIGDEATLRKLFPSTRRHGPVLVERQELGFDHRLLVVDGNLIVATRRVAPFVIGDGKSSVGKLIKDFNNDPQRGEERHQFLEKISIDEEVLRVLAGQGFNLRSVPIKDLTVCLRFSARTGTGGTCIDVTSTIHPDNQVIAERAAKVIGLDIAGVDIIIPDIARSHLEVGGVVCEVNPTPGFGSHFAALNSPNPVCLTMEAFFPITKSARIPTVLITGTDKRTNICRLVAAILRQAHHNVGLATKENVEIDGARIAVGDYSGSAGARMIINDPSVTAAVLETSPSDVAGNGLGLDACSISVFLGSDLEDDLGLQGYSTEKIQKVDQIIAEAAREFVILFDDDPQCMELANAAFDAKLIMVGKNENSKELKRHHDSGETTVFLQTLGEKKTIVLRSGKLRITSFDIPAIPAKPGVTALDSAHSVLFTAAIAYSLGLKMEIVEATIRDFLADGKI